MASIKVWYKDMRDIQVFIAEYIKLTAPSDGTVENLATLYA